MDTTPSCPRCRSVSVQLAMEVPSGRFLICHDCSHRWSVSTGGRRLPVPKAAAATDPGDDTSPFVPPTAA